MRFFRKKEKAPAATHPLRFELLGPGLELLAGGTAVTKKKEDHSFALARW